jgi:hypothetical protein
MANGEQSGSCGRADWRVRLAGAVGAGVGGALCLLIGSLADLRWPWWWGMIAFGAAIAVGILLGQLVGSLLFRRPPGR